MRYLLRHISQLSLLTVLLLSVGCLCLWIPAIGLGHWTAALSMLLCIVNTSLMIYLSLRSGITKMIDLFAGLSYLALTSSLAIYYSSWHGMLMSTMLLMILIIMQFIDRHQSQSAAEYAFLMAILLAIASYWMPSLLLCTIVLVATLMYRNAFDGQAFLAILLGFAVVAIYAGILTWIGWIDFTWKDFFAREGLWGWLNVAEIFLAIVMNHIAYKGEAVWRGLTYISYLLLCLGAWVTICFIV